MQLERSGLVPIGEALADLSGPVQALRKTSPPDAAGLHRCRSGKPIGRGQRSGPGDGLHGAAAGAVLIAPHQSGQP